MLNSKTHFYRFIFLYCIKQCKKKTITCTNRKAAEDGNKVLEVRVLIKLLEKARLN